MAGPFVQQTPNGDTPGTNVATCALTGVVSTHELLAIVVGSQEAVLSLTSVEETTTSTALTPLLDFTVAQVGGQPAYIGVGVYVLTSPPASPSVTATLSTGANAQLFLAESSVTGLALDVASALTVGTTTGTVKPSFSNELLIAVESYAFNWGAPGPYFTNWTNGFTEEDYSVSNTTAPSTDWAYLQQPTPTALDVSATTVATNAVGSILVALKTSGSTATPQLDSINDSLYAPTLASITTSATGGTLTGGYYLYQVTAYDAAGETVGSNSQTVTTVPISVPSGVAAALSSTAGSLANQEWYWGVTALGANGETTISSVVTATTTSADPSATISWTEVPGAIAYNVYRNSSNSFTGSVDYYTVTGGSTTSYLDTGAAPTGSKAPPSANNAYSASNGVAWTEVPNAVGYNLYVQHLTAVAYFTYYDVGNVTSYTDTGATPTGVATAPTVSTADAVLAEGATAVPVAGVAFDSTLTIALQQNGISVEQPVIYGSATTATLDVATSNAAGQHLAFSTGVDDPVYPTTAVSGRTGQGLPVVLTPPAGLIFQTLGTPHPNPAMRISALPDFVAGDQLEAAGDATGTTAPPAGTALHSDGSFEATADFWVRAYIQADAAWTPWTLITVSPEQPGQGFFGGGGV